MAPTGLHKGRSNIFCDIMDERERVHYGAKNVAESFMETGGGHYCYYLVVLLIPVNLTTSKDVK
jgi:hypothetical protein